MEPSRPEDLNRSRRGFSETPSRKRKGLRDTDAAERSVLTNALFGAIPGFILGGALGFFLVAKGMAPLWVAALSPFLGAAFVTGLTLLVTYKTAAAASTLYTPSGRSTPRKKEYSRAEALAARGLYQEAVTEFELAVADDPVDPTPYLRVARINRDHLGHPEDAARWFRRALREATLAPGQAYLARRELVELYVHRTGTPEKALPELARMREEMAGTPEGAWAEAEYASIKEAMREGPAGGPEGEEAPGTTR